MPMTHLLLLTRQRDYHIIIIWFVTDAVYRHDIIHSYHMYIHLQQHGLHIYKNMIYTGVKISRTKSGEISRPAFGDGYLLLFIASRPSSRRRRRHIIIILH